jgi:hypothetical protein|tara:strand:- start:220 stop:702 length:483 start_codon:yes stop_codon:yes gene_type:complete
VIGLLCNAIYERKKLKEQIIKLAVEIITSNAKNCELLELEQYSLRSDLPTENCRNKCDCPHRDHLDMPYMLEVLELDEIELDSEVQHRLAKEFSANPSVSFLKQIDHDYGMFSGELEYVRNSSLETLDDEDELDILTRLEILELENTVKECESLLKELIT